MDCNQFQAKVAVARRISIGRSEIAELREHARDCSTCSRWLEEESHRSDRLVPLIREIKKGGPKGQGILAGFLKRFRQ